MPRFRYLNALLLAGLLVAAGCASSGQTAPAPPASGGSSGMENNGEHNAAKGNTGGEAIQTVDYDVNDLTYPSLPDFQIPDVTKMTLDNGLKVFLIEDHELPTVSASARIGAGEVWAPADKAGLASMTGTVMRTGGTQSMSSDEVNQLLENLGATVETNIGETSGSAYLNTLAENVDRVLPVFVDVLAHPVFAQDKVDQAKSQAKTGISRRNDTPGQIVGREFQKLVYGEDSPYARVPQYYTIDDITRADLENFHDQYFHPNNTILSVWGDFDTAQMKQKLQQAFGSWKRDPDFERPALPQPEGEKDYAVHLVQKDDVNQSIVRMGYLGELTKDDPDYFPVTVMNQVLSGGFTSRLFKNVRTDQGLAYSAGGRYIAGYRRPGYFYAQTRTKSGTTVKAARSVVHEIKRMRQAPPSQKEVQLAKDAFLNSFVFNFDTRREILGRLMTYDYYDYPPDFLEQTKEGISSVTPDDVYGASKKYLHPDRMDLLVLGRSQDFDQPLSTLTKGGSVDTLDISIPTSVPGEGSEEGTASEEQRAAGRDLLADVREAMGGADAYDRIENIRQSTNTEVGAQTLESTLATDLAGQVHAEVKTPRGTLTIIDTGEQAYIQTPQGTQPAPPQVRRQFLGQLQHNLTYLMARSGDLEVADQGMKTVEGTAYHALRITPPAGDPFTLMVDPDTMMPARMSYQAKGQKLVSVFNDFREKSGVMVPHETVVYQGGQQRGKATVTGFETNVDFPEGYFTVDQ